MEREVVAVEFEAGDAVRERVPDATHRGDVQAFACIATTVFEVDRGGCAEVGEGAIEPPGAGEHRRVDGR